MIRSQANTSKGDKSDPFSYTRMEAVKMATVMSAVYVGRIGLKNQRWNLMEAWHYLLCDDYYNDRPGLRSCQS